MHCLQRYTALRPVEVIYNQEYDLDKYLVGALQAKYDPPPSYKEIPKTSQGNGSFKERLEVKESLQIELKPIDDSKIAVKTITIEDSSVNDQKTNSQSENPEFNPRCGYCIGLRLMKTAKYAVQNGFEAFTTTLLDSKYQPHKYIRTLGERLATKNGIEFYYKDFRTNWKESIRISKELQLYRQKYCGCIFSEYERFSPEDRK